MKIKSLAAPYLICMIILVSCVGQNNAFIPVPDFSVYDNNKIPEIGYITQTRDGVSAEFMPEWVLAFIGGGIEAVERISYYNDKYVFIGTNGGGADKFAALSKWAENFSAAQDFAVLAANRIENRLISNASLYPDDEYGLFFEMFVKNAYGAEYQGAEKEDIYWVKHSMPEVYDFFVLFTIQKNTMQVIVRRIMTQANAAARPAGSQAVSVNRLRQTFFEGF